MLDAAWLLLAHNPRLEEIHLIWVSDAAWRQRGDYMIPAGSQHMEAKEFGPLASGGPFKRRFQYALQNRMPLLGSVSRELERLIR
jgi:hypothetical protein